MQGRPCRPRSGCRLLNLGVALLQGHEETRPHGTQSESPVLAAGEAALPSLSYPAGRASNCGVRLHTFEVDLPRPTATAAEWQSGCGQGHSNTATALLFLYPNRN
jgi:hypothetical protein